MMCSGTRDCKGHWQTCREMSYNTATPKSSIAIPQTAGDGWTDGMGILQRRAVGAVDSHFCTV